MRCINVTVSFLSTLVQQCLLKNYILFKSKTLLYSFVHIMLSHGKDPNQESSYEVVHGTSATERLNEDDDAKLQSLDDAHSMATPQGPTPQGPPIVHRGNSDPNQCTPPSPSDASTSSTSSASSAHSDDFKAPAPIKSHCTPRGKSRGTKQWTNKGVNKGTQKSTKNSSTKKSTKKEPTKGNKKGSNRANAAIPRTQSKVNAVVRNPAPTIKSKKKEDELSFVKHESEIKHLCKLSMTELRALREAERATRLAVDNNGDQADTARVLDDYEEKLGDVNHSIGLLTKAVEGIDKKLQSHLCREDDGTLSDFGRWRRYLWCPLRRTAFERIQYLGVSFDS